MDTDFRKIKFENRIFLLLLVVTVLALFLFEDSSWFREAPRVLHLFI